MYLKFLGLIPFNIEYFKDYSATLSNRMSGVRRAAIRKLEHELGIPSSGLDVNDFKYMTRLHYISDSDKLWGEHEGKF